MDIQPEKQQVQNRTQAKFDNTNNQQKMMLGINSTNSHNLQDKLYQPQIAFKQHVRCFIQGDKQHIQFQGILTISDQIYVFQFGLNSPTHVQQQQQAAILLNIQYRVTQTIGTNAHKLLIFINSQKCCNSDEQEQQQNEQQTIIDQLISLIKKEQKGNFFLRGQCTITVQFSPNPLTIINNNGNGRQTMQKAYDLLSIYIGEQDQGASQYEQDQQMQQMIRADDIDENGNIIVRDKSQSSDQEQEQNQMQDQSQNI